MTGYWRRLVDDELDALAELPAICLEGPRAVGKTTTLLRRAASRFDLDDASVRETVSADPLRVVEAPPPVAVDEWQRLPAVWDLVRRAVDADQSPGRFLLAGSAPPASLPTHSGAGRIVGLRMRPLALAERRDNDLWTAPTVSLGALLGGQRPDVGGRTEARLADYVEEVLKSGFPATRRLPPRARRAALGGYIDRIVERDIAESGRDIRNPSALRRWLAAYAAASGTTASFEKIRDAATGGQGEKPSRKATTPYLDTLERLYVVDPLAAWAPTRNPLARLTAGPKHFLADPALAAQILRVDAGMLLEGKTNGPAIPRDGTMLGALFESLAALSLRVYAQLSEASVGHLRQWGGKREVDFVVTARDGRVVAVEAKLAQVVRDHDVRHLRWLQQEIGDQLADAAVITTGPEAYRRSDGIAVVPAALLGP
ncbi:MAG: ATP-binding protein [Acidimicrobiaceae bacterium]|nr:ATP-binding protein [Acidimicrobiaceae bacterium]MYE76129.1 ATP-binding protein [Acidimicrobiaceae bacterium]MYH44402.1 ATP-binding protein [Acidimicrobiaceae bacterium]MYJ42887.1 ATP-binding protein [Acidimicrobiaceae bacterium]MYK74295.1 ATP-binding protein [Acidimicrobiaceae bacterium]